MACRTHCGPGLGRFSLALALGGLLWVPCGGLGQELEDEYLVTLDNPSAETKRSLEVVGRTNRLALVKPGRVVRARGLGSGCESLLAQFPEIRHCEPNAVLTLFRTPNDPLLGELPALALCRAQQAWEKTVGDRSVAVGVIDTGIEATHSDLAANIWANPGEVPGNGIDDNLDGYIDDYHGYNAIAGSGGVEDDNDHGTHVSGLIGAVGDNATGIAGVSWRVTIVPVKAFNKAGVGTVYAAIRGIEYLLALKERGLGIVAINNSWGGTTRSLALEDAISRASDMGILFVVAAGNSGKDLAVDPVYPASSDLPNLISVAAFDDSAGAVASFSNHGGPAEVLAPGVSILSTVRGNEYRRLTGTSMAAPFVTGAAVIAAACNPRLNGSQLRDLLLESKDATNGLLDLQRLSDVACGAAAEAGRRLEIATTPRKRGGVLLTARLTDGSGRPVPGERLTVSIRQRRRSPERALKSLRTDAEGQCRMVLRRLGVYSVTANKDTAPAEYRYRAKPAR